MARSVVFDVSGVFHKSARDSEFTQVKTRSLFAPQKPWGKNSVRISELFKGEDAKNHPLMLTEDA